MELNEHQELAVKYDTGHVLVLAGAGTGKTRTITARAAYLVQKGVDPRRILLLTFTRRAAREMTQRLEAMIGQQSASIMAGTFHHFCLYTMRRMGDLFGVDGTTVIDRDDQVQLMKLARSAHVEKNAVFPKAAELVKLVSYARNTAQPMSAYLTRHTEYAAESCVKIEKIAQDYDARKRENHYLDYDDILFVFSKKLHEEAAVRERVRRFYDHILVDEMQDTNPLQWLILDGLRDPALLFCVGDDAQSIYAFRGADFKNVHSFTERVPGAVVLRLERNYRSTQGILDVSNWLLDQSPLKYEKHLVAHRKTVSTPHLLDFDTDFDEARWVVKDLIHRHETGAPWSDHMIITRSANGARAVESFMVERKVPYRFIGGTSLLQAAHVKDLFSLIRSAASHYDQLGWMRYLTLWPRLGDATATKLIVAIGTGAKTVDDALAILDKKLKNRQDITNGVRRVLENWNSPVAAIQQAHLFLSPILERRYADWKRRKADFRLLERLAERHRSLMAFLETYTLDPISTTDAERLEGEDLVILTTAHSAKGTESKVCYLIRVEPGMYPHIRSLGVQDQEEEERRILYVAMTRAEDELIITRSRRVGGYFTVPYGTGAHSAGGTEYFLKKLPDHLVQVNAVHIEPDTFSDYDTIFPWMRKD